MLSSSKLEVSSQNLSIDNKIKLGQGNFGIVYLGNYLNTSVAVKVCRTNHIANIDMDDSIQSLKREMSIFDKINEHITSENQAEHDYTGLIQYYGSLENFTGIKYLIVMEYANAGSLANWIFNKNQTVLPSFNWGLGINVINDVLKGLYTLHKFKFIHSDMKTENILLNKSIPDADNPLQVHGKLCDFGLTVSESEIYDADLGGSPGFMAPELLLYGELSIKSDIYSLACIMLEMAKQNEIYKDLSFKSIDELKVYIEKNNRDNIPSKTPKSIAHMITLGWMKNPKDRPTTKQLIDILNKPNDKISEEIKNYTRNNM